MNPKEKAVSNSNDKPVFLHSLLFVTHTHSHSIFGDYKIFFMCSEEVSPKLHLFVYNSST